MIEGHHLGRLFIAATLLAGCGGGGGGDAPIDCTAPFTLEITLDATSIPIGGATTYTAVIGNPCSTGLSDVFLQAYTIQGETERAAGGMDLGCSGQADGVAPPGVCTITGRSFGVTNQNGGNGELVPGAASALVELRRDGVADPLASATSPITLTE